MLKAAITMTALLAFAATAYGQSKNTTIKTVDGEVVEVIMEDRPVPDDVFNSFNETDADGDGRISRSEARDAGILSFDRADIDSSGWLDEPEYEQARHSPN